MERISIKNFHKAESDSPYVGGGVVARSVNLDIFTMPGVARVNYKPSFVSSSASFAGIPLWAVRDPNSTSDIYVLDASHYIGKSANSGDTWAGLTHSGNDSNGNAPSAGVGNGFIIWKKYLVQIGNTGLDFYGLTNAGPNNDGTFAGLWKNRRVTTLTNSFKWHTAFVSRNDGCLYVADKNVLHKIKEVSGQIFDPTNSATYTVDSPNALTLPVDYQIRCIEERGLSIWVGTYKGTNIFDFQDATVFPWDRNSTNYDMPFFVPECGVQAMKNIAGTLYCIMGVNLQLYTLTEGGLHLEGKLPADFIGGNFCEVYPGAIDILKGNLAFGISAGTQNSTVSFTPLYGIYSWKGKFAMEHTIASGNTGRVVIGAILPLSSNAMLFCWYDPDFVTTSYGVDKMSVLNGKYASYAAYFESIFYRIGVNSQKGNISRMEAILSKVFASGGGVQIKYRRGFDDAWTTYDTLIFSNWGAVYSIFKSLVFSSENLQVQVGIIGDTEILEFNIEP